VWQSMIELCLQGRRPLGRQLSVDSLGAACAVERAVHLVHRHEGRRHSGSRRQELPAAHAVLPCQLAPSSLSAPRRGAGCGLGRRINSSLETLWVELAGKRPRLGRRTALSSSSLSNLMRSPPVVVGGGTVLQAPGLSIDEPTRPLRAFPARRRGGRWRRRRWPRARAGGPRLEAVSLTMTQMVEAGSTCLSVSRRASTAREAEPVVLPRCPRSAPASAARQDLLVLRLARHAARLSQDAQDPVALAPRIARGQSSATV